MTDKTTTPRPLLVVGLDRKVMPMPSPFCGCETITVSEGSTFRWAIGECDNCGASYGEVRVNTMQTRNMELNKNVPHRFDLSGMEPGDKFLGCIDCNIQHDKNAAAKPKCFHCGNDMQIYYVTNDDVTPNV